MSDRRCAECSSPLAHVNKTGFCKGCQSAHVGAAGKRANARDKTRRDALKALRPTRRRVCTMCGAVMMQLRRVGRPPITCSGDCARLQIKIRSAA